VGQGDVGLGDGVGLGAGVGVGVGGGLVVRRGPVVGGGLGVGSGLGSRLGRSRGVGVGGGPEVLAGCVGPDRSPDCSGDAGPDSPPAPAVVVGVAAAGTELDNGATPGPPAPGVAGTDSVADPTAPSLLEPVDAESRLLVATRMPATTSVAAVAATAAASAG
jgi:hypothetical protein